MKIGVVSLGCPKNLVDSETMLGLIHEENYEITNDPSEAEIIRCYIYQQRNFSAAYFNNAFIYGLLKNCRGLR